jgi:signal transduction histidine kinase
MEKKRLQVSISLPQNDIILAADGSRLQHALGQLLDNAIKFTSPGGRIVVGAHGPTRSPWPETGQALFAVMAVADTGVGIPPEKQQAIFKAFTQVNMSNERRFGGLGMGLTIAARIVSAHRGRIMLKSEPGMGSTFAIWLPMQPRATSQLSPSQSIIPR